MLSHPHSQTDWLQVTIVRLFRQLCVSRLAGRRSCDVSLLDSVPHAPYKTLLRDMPLGWGDNVVQLLGASPPKYVRSKNVYNLVW